MAKIERIVNHGTIVQVVLDTGQVVNFDHRPFGWMYEAEGGNLIGREVESDGQTMRFLDGEVGA